MKRDLDALATRTFDLLVVGAGIHGAWAAWDAAQRGFSVALVDRGDFGAGASANSLRIVHGGLRYLQTLDVPRMRESIRERAALLRLAAGRVRPLPCVIATRGNGRDGALAMRAALGITDLIGFDRNAGLGEHHRLPGGRILTRAAAAALAPELPLEDATGGALWYDAQAVDSEALTLACVRSAVRAGAVAANHIAATSLIRDGGRITGAWLRDGLTGREFAVSAAVTLLAVGGRWSAPPFDEGETPSGEPVVPAEAARPAALAMNLVVDRRLGGPAAFAVRAPLERPDPGGAGTRYLFFVPWRDATLIGTFYRLVDAADQDRPVTRALLAEMTDVARRAVPALDLDVADVRLVHKGLLPLKEDIERGDPVTLAGHHRLVLHPHVGRVIVVEGVKFTTARSVAAHAVDQVARMLDRPRPATTRSAALDFGDAPPVAAGAAPGRDRILHAIREEMAVRLDDVVLRRTQWGVTGCPPDESLAEIAGVMAAELGWDAARRAAEIAALRAAYEPCDGAGQPLAAALGGRA